MFDYVSLYINQQDLNYPLSNEESLNAWMEAFGVTSPEEQEKGNSRLTDRVRLLEARVRKLFSLVRGYLQLILSNL